MIQQRTFTRRSALHAGLTVTAAGLAGCPTIFSSDPQEVAERDPDRIRIRQTIHGTLESDDGRDPKYGDIAEPVRFRLDEQARVSIEMTSDDIESYLLVSKDGSVVAEHNYGVGGNSTIERTLEPGSYTIWVGSASGEETGLYTLELHKLLPERTTAGS